MNDSLLLAIILLVMSSRFVLLAGLLIGGRKRRIRVRLEELSSGEAAANRLPAQAVPQVTRTTAKAHRGPAEVVRTAVKNRLGDSRAGASFFLLS